MLLGAAVQRKHASDEHKACAEQCDDKRESQWAAKSHSVFRVLMFPYVGPSLSIFVRLPSLIDPSIRL